MEMIISCSPNCKLQSYRHAAIYKKSQVVKIAQTSCLFCSVSNWTARVRAKSNCICTHLGKQ